MFGVWEVAGDGGLLISDSVHVCQLLEVYVKGHMVRFEVPRA